tara:strand:- start:177 stop:395 length:219 start_codon:yes stop_codon:yes gene_type:complete
MEIKERKLKAAINKEQNGFLVNGSLEIEINPVGTLKSKIIVVAWMITTEIKISGNCYSGDETAFNTAKQKAN